MRLFLIILMWLSVTVLKAQKDINTNEIDKLFSKYKSDQPGLTVLIRKDGNAVYNKSFGLSNLEYNIPISSNTIFNANSLSKQFVAFAIYLLEKENKISLEDNIQKYLPDFPEYDKPIKIKHLLSHTSGLKDQWGLLSLSGYRFDDFISNEKIFKLVYQQERLNFETNTQHGYSHTNYSLLAKVIEVVSNQSFPEFMKDNIFSPLHMNNSFYPKSPADIIKNKAYSYKEVDGHFEKVILNYQNYGSTNLMTTVDDLAKWVSNFKKPIIGNKKLLKKFNEKYILDNGELAEAAKIGDEEIIGCKGQYYRNYKGLDLYSHGGFLGGFRSYIGRFPKENFSIIILSNNNGFKTNPTALAIADICLKGEKMEAEIKNISIKDLKKKDNDVVNTDLKKFTGTYYNKEIDTTFQVKINENKLYLIHKRLSDLALKIESENSFSTIINFPATLSFVENENVFQGFNISGFGVKEMYFKRIR